MKPYVIEPLTRAISIRQPYVELILLGKKRREFRSRPTNVRGRVWLYASLKPVDDGSSWRRVRRAPGELPTGVIVGSVEIVACEDLGDDGFAYVLAKPKRCKPWKSRRQPQPIFWRPIS